MDLIKFIDDSFIKNPSSYQYSDWAVRIAARGVIINDQKNIALMHIKKYSIYKLPGGGVETHEEIHEALEREVKEETGLETEMIAPIGIVIEKREEQKLFQVSYCFLLKYKSKGETSLTEKEVEEGFELYWAKDIDDAISIIKLSENKEEDNVYIRLRETDILLKAKEKLANY